MAVIDAPSEDPAAAERLCTKLQDDHGTIFLGPSGMEVSFAGGTGHIRISAPVDEETLVATVHHVWRRTDPTLR